MEGDEVSWRAFQVALAGVYGAVATTTHNAVPARTTTIRAADERALEKPNAQPCAGLGGGPGLADGVSCITARKGGLPRC